jgi:hypothetical protein
MALRGYHDRPPFAEEHNLALHLVQGHGFRSPFSPSAEAPPSAFNAPLYPLIIAASYRATGIRSSASITLLMLVNALCFGASAAALFELGRGIFRDAVPGLLAALLFSLHPLFLFFAADFWDGMLSLALFLWVAVGALSKREAAGDRPGSWSWRAVALGAAMGLVALANTVYTATYPLLLALAFPRRLGRRRWWMAGLAVAAYLVVLAPWSIRNLRSFDRFVLVRTGFGLALWLGNEPASDGWLDGKEYQLHPSLNLSERESLLSLGEPAYNAYCVERFRRHVQENPLGFWRLCAQRIVYLLIDQPAEPAPYPFLSSVPWHRIFLDRLLLNAFLAGLGLAGIVAASCLGFRPGGLAGLLVCAALPFVPTAVMDRYTLPVRALLVLFAAGFLWMAGARILSGRWPEALPT